MAANLWNLLKQTIQVSAVKQAKVEVLQLRREASLTRINVSQAIEDMKVKNLNKQAGAVLGQAQPKLGLGFTAIQRFE